MTIAFHDLVGAATSSSDVICNHTIERELGGLTPPLVSTDEPADTSAGPIGTYSLATCIADKAECASRTGASWLTAYCIGDEAKDATAALFSPYPACIADEAIESAA